MSRAPDFLFWSAGRMAAAIRSGRISALEAVGLSAATRSDQSGD